MGIIEIIRIDSTVLKKMSHSLKTFTTKCTVCKHTRWEDRQGSTIGWVDRMKSDFLFLFYFCSLLGVSAPLGWISPLTLGFGCILSLPSRFQVL